MGVDDPTSIVEKESPLQVIGAGFLLLCWGERGRK